MERKCIYRKILILLIIINLAALAYFFCQYVNKQIPNEIKMLVNKEEEFNFDIPMAGNINTADIGVLSINNKSVPSSQININLNRPFTMKSSQVGQYTIQLKLFGFLKFKEVKLDVIDQLELIPSGQPIGIYVQTDGIMVLGTSVITCIDGLNYEPALNKLKSGDYIMSVNNKQLESKQDLIDMIQASEGKALNVQVRRNDDLLNVSITPVETAAGEYKIGTWIRDDTQGIGTMTFISTNGDFGALGHGITDIDTNLLMEIGGGDVYTAEIMSIIKGKNGSPGEIIGLINQSDNNRVGTIEKNTNQGIFGRISNSYRYLASQGPMEIGLKQDVEIGKAYIMCNIDGTVGRYEIYIEKVDHSNSQRSKGMVIEIVDEKLLSITGGIVQGMSGSPIIQNGKIIGAVTHVFIQDSTKGYGTFIENMLRNIE